MTFSKSTLTIEEFQQVDGEKVLAGVKATKEPLIITNEGQVSAVLLDVGSYRQMLETIGDSPALEKLEQVQVLVSLALGIKQIEAGQGIPLEAIKAELTSKYGL